MLKANVVCLSFCILHFAFPLSGFAGKAGVPVDHFGDSSGPLAEI